MFRIRTENYERKGGSTSCVHCFGMGWTETRSGDRRLCHDCLGHGRYTTVDPTTEDHYEVRNGADLIDAGGPLDDLLAGLPTPTPDDLVVWLVREGETALVVCVVRPGWEGENVVVWL